MIWIRIENSPFILYEGRTGLVSINLTDGKWCVQLQLILLSHEEIVLHFPLDARFTGCIYNGMLEVFWYNTYFLSFRCHDNNVYKLYIQLKIQRKERKDHCLCFFILYYCFSLVTFVSTYVFKQVVFSNSHQHRVPSSYIHNVNKLESHCVV